MAVRGIRGAITIAEDCETEVLQATRELLGEIIIRNQIVTEDIASIIFTATPDIKSTFPAKAARTMGMHLVPLLGGQEMAVEGAITRCIRVLMHINTDLAQSEIEHVYLREAVQLRGDLVR